MKTLQELKDEVSRKWTSKNFDDISSDDARVNMAFKVTILGEAAELYASQFQEQLSALQQENEKLRKFKQYVHSRLDDMGIPADPEPEKNAKHGCRIEGRLNFIQKKTEGWIDTVNKSCPNCLYDDIVMFMSGLDLCKRCGQKF